MATKRGYLDFSRKDFEYKSVEDRREHFEEFLVLQDSRELKRQAARCMGCETPYCHGIGCPAFNIIPLLNDFVLRNKWEEAYEHLISANPLPEFTGRICPAICEAACSLSINMAPVTIRQIEFAIIEKAFLQNWVLPIRVENEKHTQIAIIGGGPAGISAAIELRKRGYQVTIIEKSEKIGGLLRYGIPEYKLPNEIIDRRVEWLEKSGIHIKTKYRIGEEISINELVTEFDGILLATGAGVPRPLGFSWEGIKGVHYALEYLGQPNRAYHKEKKVEGIIHAGGKRVLVIGGGDTGSDCIGTAIRQGATAVTQVEILPKPREWTDEYNPNWPDYPMYYRTSSSHKEGCARDFNVNVKSFRVENGQVTGVYCNRVVWSQGVSGRMEMTEIPGSDYIIEAEYVFISIGFIHTVHETYYEELGIHYDERGNIAVNERMQTGNPKVFSAGDATTGASLVVRAIEGGKRVANEMDRYFTTS